MERNFVQMKIAAAEKDLKKEKEDPKSKKKEPAKKDGKAAK